MPPVYPGTLRPLWVIAGWLQRSDDTVRSWYRRGELQPKACDVRTRALLFDLHDAAQLHLSSAIYKPSRDTPTNVLAQPPARVHHPP